MGGGGLKSLEDMSANFSIIRMLVIFSSETPPGVTVSVCLSGVTHLFIISSTQFLRNPHYISKDHKNISSKANNKSRKYCKNLFSHLPNESLQVIGH